MKRTLALTLANKMYKDDRGVALKKAWEIANDDKPLGSRISGVGQGKRQTALERLKNYAPEQIFVTLEADSDTIKVLVNIEKREKYHLGNLPPKMTKLLTHMMKKGIEARATFTRVTEGYEENAIYGAYIGIEL